VHVRAQQSPKFVHAAPDCPHPIFPPHVPFMQSLLQQLAEDAQIKPSGVQLGRTHAPATQLPLQQLGPVVHAAPSPAHDPEGEGAAQTPEQEVLQQSSHDKQLVPRALQVAATWPSATPLSTRPLLPASPPAPEAQLRTTTAAATASPGTIPDSVVLTVTMAHETYLMVPPLRPRVERERIV
jgi:hypothetical protein